jgi:hypothetical protein
MEKEETNFHLISLEKRRKNSRILQAKMEIMVKIYFPSIGYQPPGLI